ncbi:MAG: threonine--tRNA ligase [Candidatus Harrisonbacteria bacterium RIFCSPLOWO2_02_FULL_45_10c]|uniref:Threonine--tRNA ligase n=1 Tax=Candidatus Harrisonbacteria bacterium RIFCSPLOWO2_02_FULL_45_10c TaxID=1798410 RepID=A0A1G1ZTM9_9BACT|nr:MAG: threonine--tRNA ligase [Candidatus Harrisonbacteria bacterium RIFCSPLOWO2_02_FULL_45_10c]
MAPENKIEEIRHSLAHLLAAAVLKKYPNTKLGIGPVIENGFYYDFKFLKPISAEDLPGLEQEMKRLIGAKLNFTGKPLTPTEAKKIFKTQPFKLELIKDFTKEKKDLTLYRTGEVFEDLCRGGHVQNTQEIDPDAFKLTHLAGAYWRGDEKNPMLTRIYAVAFNAQAELDEHLRMLEESKKRDHRKLGKELELFTIIDEIGPGLPLFYPKGALLRRIVENYITNLQERNGYEPIWIPHITKKNLYEISGHLKKYDALYPPMKLKDEADYYLKPMNCPHFMMLYKSVPHSYRELPIRWTATTTNYRYEKSGELSGLTRVRALTQDDCHVFVAPEQIQPEISRMLDMIKEAYDAFEFKNFWVRISTHDPGNAEKYIGDPAIWTQSEAILSACIKERGWKHTVVEGEAAFYGPKLDFMFKDALGREWQLSTIQLDMNLPKKFELEYADADGSKKQPIVIHRAVLGSTERFLGILIEHFAGAFPAWLAPVQAVVVPISEKQKDYAQKLINTLHQNNIRANLNDANETLGKRIRASELQKIPYILVVGDKEAQANAVAVRRYGKGDLGGQTIDEFLKLITTEIQNKKAA